MKSWRFVTLPAALLIFAPACGGSTDDSGGGEGSCTTAPCGGDLVGTWAAKQACASGSLISTVEGCAATTSIKSWTVGGTMRFDADGTWHDALSETASAHEVIAATCFTAAQCTQHESSLANEPGITSAKCDFGTECACDYVQTVSVDKTATYQTSGTSVTFSGPASQPETDGYCLSGSTLTLQSALKGTSVSLVFARQGA